MPKQKKIVMQGLTDEERRAAVKKNMLEKHEPYKAFKSPVRRQGWVLVYDSPRTTQRSLVMDQIQDGATARDLKALLETAWFEGYMASTED